MGKTLLEVISEAKESSDDQLHRELQAENVATPVGIAKVRRTLYSNKEYELYEFLSNCEWWIVRNKNAEGWHGTAGVRATHGVIEFYYDEDFMKAISASSGQLMFLIAHEASHIFRLHADRQDFANKNGEVWNTATDMIINKDILETPKIGAYPPEDITNEHAGFNKEKIAELEKQTGLPWEVLKRKTIGLRVPKSYHEFVKKYKDKIKLAYTSDGMYNYLLKDAKKKPPNGKQPKRDYFADGTIVKVSSGKHAGEYRRIVRKDKQGGYITVPVDIQAEIKKAGGK